MFLQLRSALQHEEAEAERAQEAGHKLCTLEAEVAAKSSALAEAAQAEEELSAQVEMHKAQVSDLQGRMSDMQRQITTLQHELADMQRQMADSRARSAELEQRDRARVMDAEAAAREAHSALANREYELQGLRAEVSMLTQKLQVGLNEGAVLPLGWTSLRHTLSSCADGRPASYVLYV